MTAQVFAGRAGPIFWKIHRIEGVWLGVEPGPGYLGDDETESGVARHYREHNGELRPKYSLGWLIFRHSDGVVIWSEDGYARIEDGRVEGCYKNTPVAGRVDDEFEFAWQVVLNPRRLLDFGVV